MQPVQMDRDVASWIPCGGQLEEHQLFSVHSLLSTSSNSSAAGCDRGSPESCDFGNHHEFASQSAVKSNEKNSN